MPINVDDGIFKALREAGSSDSQIEDAKLVPRYGWYLCDFANSILIINGGLYFPQWIVKSNGVSDFTYNLMFVLRRRQEHQVLRFLLRRRASYKLSGT